MKLGLPSIGGKDSMSGTFHEIDVPPTLVSFAINVANINNVITPELKKADNVLVLLKYSKDKYDLPNFDEAKELFQQIHGLAVDKKIESTYALGRHGLVSAISKMAFGNGLGVIFEDSLSPEELFAEQYCYIVAEIKEETLKILDKKNVNYQLVGKVSNKQKIEYKDMIISMDEALNSWTSTLEDVFPTVSRENKENIDVNLTSISNKNIYVNKNKIAKPRVFIPISQVQMVNMILSRPLKKQVLRLNP